MMKRQTRHIQPSGWIGLGIVAVACGMAGCATYHAKPLDRATVDAALRAPSLAEVRIAAGKIEHPLLRPVTIDGKDGFSPDEIALMAVIVSPQLRAARDQRGVAQAQVLQAGILPNPQIGFTADVPHGNHDPTLVTGRSLGLSWDVASLLVHHDEVAAAKASAQALDLDLAWQEWQVAEEARLRAFRILSLEQQLPLARAMERDRAETLGLMKQAVDFGQRTRSDLVAARTAWTEAQTARLDVEQALAAERIALNVTLGQPPDEALRLKPAAEFPVLAPGAATAGSLLDGLEKRRLDLVALRLGYQSEEASLRAAVMTQFPNIGLNFNQARDTSDVRTLGFGVAIDLPLFDHNQGRIALHRATRQQLFDEYLARVASARAEVARILSNLAGARARLRSVDAELPGLEHEVAALGRELRTHDTDILSYREARAAWLARRMDRARLRQDALELGVALEIATGRPLLNRPPPT